MEREGVGPGGYNGIRSSTTSAQGTNLELEIEIWATGEDECHGSVVDHVNLGWESALRESSRSR